MQPSHYVRTRHGLTANANPSIDSLPPRPGAPEPGASATPSVPMSPRAGLMQALRRSPDKHSHKPSHGSYTSEDCSPIARRAPLPVAITHDRQPSPALPPLRGPIQRAPSPPSQLAGCMPPIMRHVHGMGPTTREKRLSALAHDIHTLLGAMDRLRLCQYDINSKLTRLKGRMDPTAPPLVSSADARMWHLINSPMTVRTEGEVMPTSAQKNAFLEKAYARRAAIAQEEQRLVEDILLEHGEHLSPSDWSMQTAARTLRLRSEDLLLHYHLEMTRLSGEQSQVRSQLDVLERQERALRWQGV